MKAFPVQESVPQDDDYEGMDLRDYFAAKAMQALVNKYTPDHDKYLPSTKPIVETAYDIADQMMEARK